jgi:hypothetical protein
MKIREILTDMEQFIYTTEALNQILISADCPENVRSLIDYLIGFSMGRDEFIAFDGELSIYVQTENRSVTAANKWLSRTRKDLKDWQDKNNLGFVSHTEGAPNKNKINKKLPATYKLPILALIEDVMNQAQEDKKFWNKEKRLAIKLAAQDLVTKHIADPFTSIVQSSGYVKPPHVTVGQNIKLARTSLKKALLQKDDPRLKYLDDPDNVIEELEDLLEEVKYLYKEKKF